MVEIVDGEIVRDELTKNARGGTELLADRIHDFVDHGLLKGVQIIFSRPNKLLDGYKKVLYIHDLPGDPAIAKIRDAEWRNQFDLIVFVSHYQRMMFHKVYGFPLTERMIVIKNAIHPLNPSYNRVGPDKIRLIYHTTPHRGLEILYPVFDYLSKKYPGTIELKVFSSFDIYGWEQRDEPYQQLFDKLNDHPDIEYSKSVSNAEIREELMKAHIFAFPSIWEETSCMALMEAMSANLVCVHSDLGALPETSHGSTIMYPYVSDPNVHATKFAEELERAILQYDIPDRSTIGKFLIDTYHNIDGFVYDWETSLTSIR